jgi:formylglycine-generating enzyme required for sulfatase activity
MPAGRFVMGAAPHEEEAENLLDAFRHRSEPQRSVAVAAFLAGRYEVTRSQYAAFEEASGHRARGCFRWTGRDFELDSATYWRTPGYPQDDTHPVTCVSWNDAQRYVEWLSATTGKRYRLLSEAEWEYAARAGTATSRFWGDNADAVCRYANGADRAARERVADASNWFGAQCDDGHAHTAPVGRFEPNAFGLHDMLGNVGEWTQDCWNENYRGAPSDSRARTDGDCSQRAVRGGSWDDSPVGLRAAYRVGSPVVIRLYTRGFRVARDP